jgi:hypothetical protein
MKWEEFLIRLKSLPQDDPGVQAEIRNAEWTLAQTTVREPNDVEGGRQQVRQLIKQALETPTPEDLADYLGFATRFRRLAVWEYQDGVYPTTWRPCRCFGIRVDQSRSLCAP